MQKLTFPHVNFCRAFQTHVTISFGVKKKHDIWLVIDAILYNRKYNFCAKPAFAVLVWVVAQNPNLNSKWLCNNDIQEVTDRFLSSKLQAAWVFKHSWNSNETKLEERNDSNSLSISFHGVSNDFKNTQPKVIQKRSFLRDSLKKAKLLLEPLREIKEYQCAVAHLWNPHTIKFIDKCPLSIIISGQLWDSLTLRGESEDKDAIR